MLLSRAVAAIFLCALMAWTAGAIPVGPAKLPSDSAKAATAPSAAPVTTSADSTAKATVPAKPAPDPVKAKLAAKQERKLRMEYLKVTGGIVGPTLKPETLLPLLGDTNLVLLDIRQPGEQAVSMIPHAMTTPEFAQRFRRGIPKGKRIVVYCTIGYRSGKYAMELAGQGIIAENLEGGLLAWSHIGGPLEVRNPSGLTTPTRRVHIYSSGWNFLHPDYEAVW